MEQHPNAKLTPKGRETLVSRIESGLGVAEAARQMGISRQTAGKWLRRSRSGEGLSDRSSRPRRLARLTPPEVEERVLRGPLLDAARPARAGRHDGRAGAHVREDRLQAGHAEARRRRPRDRGGAPPRPGHPRALRAGEAGRAPARRRQESGPHTRRRRPPRPGARPACTSPSTTSAGSPTPSCCPTSARAPARRSWAGACASSRAWACGSSA